jgi:hypothetical protein
MKKILVIAVSLVFAGGLFAQGYVGLKGGVNYDTWNPDVEGVDNYTGLGYNIGLELGYKVMPMLAIDVGGAYYIAKYGTSEDDVDITVTINGIYIPLALRYSFMASPMVNPYVKVGGAVMMEQNGESKVGEEDAEDIVDDFLETDFFVLGGLGVDVAATPMISIRPDVTFQYNLTGDRDISDDASETAYHILFTVGFYYAF